MLHKIIPIYYALAALMNFDIILCLVQINFIHDTFRYSVLVYMILGALVKFMSGWVN